MTPYCKACQIKKALNWNYSNYDKHKEGRRKSDSKPQRKEEIYNYSKQYRKDGRFAQWQKSDSGKKSMKKSQEKRAAKQHDIAKEELTELYNFCGSKCMYCGLPEEENIKLHKQKFSKDHAINNGSNKIDNCILCCKNCSSSKKDKDWNVWYAPENKRYTIERFEKITEWLDKFQ